MAASAQELQIRFAMSHALGTPYLLEPAEVKKGTATREPADLAWVCNGCLVLINMQRSQNDSKSQNKHNLRQLRGFLRLWSKGAATLTGANEWQGFELSPSGTEDIVLLSVISSEDARAEVLHSYLEPRRNIVENRVILVASLPETVLFRLADLAGSACDLADFLLQISTITNGVDEPTALTLLEEQHAEAVRRAKVDINPLREPDLDNSIALWLVNGNRWSPKEVVHNADAFDVNADMAVFNDLDWETSTRLILSHADTYRAVRDVPVGGIGPTSAIALVQQEPYVFILAVADIRNVNELEEAGKLFTEFEADGRVPIAVNQMIVGRPEVEVAPILLAFSRNRASSVARATFREAGTPSAG